MSRVEDHVSSSGKPRTDPPWPSPNAVAAINAFVDRGPFGVAVFDTDLRFLLVSQGLAALHGHEASETVGKRIDEVISPPYGDLVARALTDVLQSGVPVLDIETWGTFADPAAERSFTSSFYRLDGASDRPLGVVVLITETTELRYAEAAARSAAEQLELLEQVTEALSGGDSVADVIRVALAGAANAVGASAAVIMALDGAGATLAHLASTGLSDDTLVRLREPASVDDPMPHCDTVRTGTITLLGSRGERDIEYPDLAGCSSDHQALGVRPSVGRRQTRRRSRLRLAPRSPVSRHRRLTPGRRRSSVCPGPRAGPHPRRRARGPPSHGIPRRGDEVRRRGIGCRGLRHLQWQPHPDCQPPLLRVDGVARRLRRPRR